MDAPPSHWRTPASPEGHCGPPRTPQCRLRSSCWRTWATVRVRAWKPAGRNTRLRVETSHCQPLAPSVRVGRQREAQQSLCWAVGPPLPALLIAHVRDDAQHQPPSRSGTACASLRRSSGKLGEDPVERSVADGDRRWERTVVEAARKANVSRVPLGTIISRSVGHRFVRRARDVI